MADFQDPGDWQPVAPKLQDPGDWQPVSSQAQEHPYFDPNAPVKSLANDYLTSQRATYNAIPFMNEIRAAGNLAIDPYRAALAGITGDKSLMPADFDKSIGERFTNALQKERATDAEMYANQPWIAYPSEIGATITAPIGGEGVLAAKAADMLPGIFAKAAPEAGNLVGKAVSAVPEYTPNALAHVVGSSAISGATGAVYGAGQGDTIPERAENSLIGAGLGTAVGPLAPLVGTAAQKIYSGVKALPESVGNAIQRLRNPGAADEAQATSQIQSALQKDIASTPAIGPEDLATAQANNQPVMVGDLGAEATRRLAKSVANTSPEAANTLKGALVDRFQQQQQRFSDFTKGLFGTDLNNQAALDKLADFSNQYVSPAYKKAYEAGSTGVWNDDLAQILQSQHVQSAIPDAIKHANEAVVSNNLSKTNPPQTLVKNPFTKDENGVYQLTQNPDGSTAEPNLQFWDQIKKTLDSKARMAFRAGDTYTGNEINNKSRELLGILDNQVPEYAEARQLAKGKITAENAVDAGAKFYTQSNRIQPDDVAKMVGSLPPVQREHFAQSYAAQMLQDAQSAGINRDLTLKFNNPAELEKMRIALNTPAHPNRAEQIETFLRTESALNLLKNKVMGNSTTIEQGTDIANKAGRLLANPLAGAIEGVGAAYYQKGIDPYEMAKDASIGLLAGGLLQYSRNKNVRINNLIAKKLASTNPSEVQEAVKMVSKNPDSLNALRKYETQLAIEAGQQAGQSHTEPVNPQAIPAMARASGGRTSIDYAARAERLIKAAEMAKKHHAADTQKILGVSDNIVAKALEIANKKI